MPLDPDSIASSTIVRSPEVNAQHPWLGLLPYKEEHREFFFGRDREVEDILGRIRDNSLTILYGQSGLGKSSLLAAGVMPRLREAGYAHRWVRLSFEDGPRFQTLVHQTNVLARAAQGTLTARDFVGESPLQQLTFWERFHHRDTPTSPVPVLIFDQFEEIFTLGAQPQFETEVADWLEQMADLLQNRPPRHLAEAFTKDRALAEQYHFGDAPVRIVFTLREDYLANLERWKAQLPLLMQNRMALTLLTGPQARQAVLGPAQLGDHSLVSREVAENIVRTVARVPADTPLDQIKAVPPLLSLLCEQLNAARSAEGQITASMVSEQADDILQRFYEDSFLNFPHEHRARIRALLEDPPMITEAGHRNALVRADAEAQLTRAGVPDAKDIFDTLIQRRLITAETRDQVQRLEITHDVLVPLLLRSRKERQDREAKEQAERTAIAAQAEKERLARQRRVLMWTVASFAVLALFAVLGAWYGWAQARAAKNAEANAIKQKDVAVTATLKAEQLAREATVARDREAESAQKAVDLQTAAEKARGEAVTQAKAATEAEAKAQALLQEHSRRDLATAIKLVVDAEDARGVRERSVYTDQQFGAGTDSVVALLARSLEAWPDNDDAALFLWLHLRMGGATKVHVPLWNVSLPGMLSGERGAVWDASGKKIALPLTDGRVVVIALEPAPHVQILTVPESKKPNDGEEDVLSYERGYTLIAFREKQGELLAVKESGGLLIWDLATGRQQDFSSDRRIISLSPDGAFAIATQPDGSAILLDLEQSKAAGAAFPLSENHGPTIEWKKDGTHFFHLDAKDKLRMRDGHTGADSGREFPGVGNAEVQVDGTGTLLLIAESTPKHGMTAGFWDIKGQPRLLQKIEGLTFVGWHPLSGRALLQRDRSLGGSGWFRQFDPRTDRITLYPGSLGEHLTTVDRGPDEGPEHRVLALSKRRELLDLPGGIAATATYDFADEDWVEEVSDFAESGAYSVLSPEGSLIAIVDSEIRTAGVSIEALRGPLTTNWRSSVETNLGTPITSPDGAYEVGIDVMGSAYLLKKEPAGAHVPVPLPFKFLSRIEWSQDGKQAIFISDSGREQQLSWPPPARWEQSMASWLSSFGLNVEDQRAQEALQLRRLEKDEDAENKPGPREPLVETAKWLDSLKGTEVKDSTWKELQKWWIDGRLGSAPSPAPQVPANNETDRR